MARWLITGASGFVGRHVLDRLAGQDVVAIGRRDPGGVRFVPVDLEDRSAVDRVMSEVSPDRVIHLAGRMPPGPPEALYRANLMATIHLLDALRACACRVVLVGSAAELGPVPVEALPVGEDYPCRPVGAYGLSKLLATSAGLAARAPLDVVVARVFNPIGPGLPTSQALGRFAGLLATGEGPITLTVGDLTARRDFVDVRDVASALVGLADRGRSGQVYHVGTGRSHRVGEGLERLIALSDRQVEVEVDPSMATSPGPTDSRANSGRLAIETGWSALIPWEQSLYDLWSDARSLARRT